MSHTEIDRRASWPHEIAGGAAGALAGLALVLTLGLLAFGALDPAAAALSIAAAFVGAVLGGSVFALLARAPCRQRDPPRPRS
jgi:TctA family transporter